MHSSSCIHYERRSMSIVDPNLPPSLFDLSLFLIFISISLRAFFLYVQPRSPRLFILSLAMGIIALTAAADFTSGIVTTISLNTDWFLFIGQAVSFTFIFLSLVWSADDSLRRLIRWQILATLLLVPFLLLAPILPNFPNPVTQLLLSGSRSLICLLIFGYYTSAFITKERLFGFLMSGAYLLLGIGYFVILPKYFLPNADLLDHTGDFIRMFGLVTLLVAYVRG